MIRKFEVEVERVDRYTIEVDDSVMTEEWMAQFREVFYDYDDIEDHVEHIAQYRARFNNGHIYGGDPEGYGDIALRGNIKPDARHPNPAINIAKADEDNVTDIYVREVTGND